MKVILHTVDIASTPANIYEALTTQEGLAGWWSRKVAADVREGGVINFTFLRNFNPDMKITLLEETKLVCWECVGGHEPWQDNKFRFEIEQRGDGSILFFRQEYTKELNDEEYGRYNCNWGFYLDSLRLLVETGRGKPYLAPKPADLKNIVERFVEEYKNKQNPDIVDELVSENCKVHIPLPGLPQGRNGMRLNGQMMCTAFPDVRVEREYFVVESDIVVERAHAVATHKGELMGMAPTGKKVTWTELHAYRVKEGKITEVWSEADFMGVMVQLGAVKMPVD